MYRILLTSWLITVCTAPAGGETVFLEAERFSELSGWAVDSQFMDQMGSPFLLAHGLGQPVADASTSVRFSGSGSYRVWVRTRDWVATWDAPGAPGRFQVAINGEPVTTTFGTKRADWHWQDGGTVQIRAGDASIVLHDLTGFEGRCDAICFSSDVEFAPPNDGPTLKRFRREQLGLPDQPEQAGEFDLVVVGGGIAGTCASVSAARLGLTVALIQDRPVLAGNNSSEIRVWLQGARNKHPYPRVGDVVRELEQKRAAHYGPENVAELYEDEKKLAVVQAEQKISLYLCHRANDVVMDGDRIRAVVAQDTKTGRCRSFKGCWFVDSTGDGCLGFLAGADYELTDKCHMGRCNLWNVIDTGKPVSFPRCPWALDLSDKPFPGRAPRDADPRKVKPDIKSLGGWYWESGFDHDPFENSEYIRDWNLRAMYGAWDALKNVDGRYPNYRLNWAAFVSGKRESRRLLGDVVLTRKDVLEGKVYSDGCVPTGWAIDLHLPDPRYETGFEGDAFIAKAHYSHYKPPYWVPYRCLYTRNIDNLFMAGRDISVTHEALGTVRVMRTGGCMGEIVGMAASLCKTHNITPRGVYRGKLNELKQLMRQGVGILPRPGTTLKEPAWRADVGENVAVTAQVKVSGCLKENINQPSLINDGLADVTDNTGRWLSNADLPNWVELAWTSPQTITAVRVVSGHLSEADRVTAPISAFAIQFHDNGRWVDIEGASGSDNTLVDWGVRFPPIRTDRVRLLTTKTRIDVSRIWEFEVYKEK